MAIHAVQQDKPGESVANIESVAEIAAPDGAPAGPKPADAAALMKDPALAEKFATTVRQTSAALAAAYGEIVALLARSPKYRHLSLADLEWLVLPPLLANQFRIVSAKMKGPQGAMGGAMGDLQMPIGLALWAMVSEEVAAKLERQQKDGAPFRLAPQEWKSGTIPWLLDIVGEPRAAQAMYKQLLETVFKGEKPRGFEVRAGH